MPHHSSVRASARVAVAALAVATASLLLLAGAGPAEAHARLVRAVPGNGSTLETAPSRVTLVFDEEMRPPSAIVVTGPTGVEVQHGTVAVADNTATVAVQVTAPGTYRVAFRVVSADGHPVTGETTFGFRYGARVRGEGRDSRGGRRAAPRRGRGPRVLQRPGRRHRRGGRPARRAGTADGAPPPGRPREPAAQGQPVTGTGTQTGATARTQTWAVRRWAAGAALVTLSVLVVVLLAGGGAPQPVPAGLPDPGAVTGWGLPVARLRPTWPGGDRGPAPGGRAAAALARGRLADVPARAVALGAGRAGPRGSWPSWPRWCSPSPTSSGCRSRRRLDPTLLRSFLGQTSQGRALLMQVALLVVVVAGLARSIANDPRGAWARWWSPWRRWRRRH